MVRPQTRSGREALDADALDSSALDSGALDPGAPDPGALDSDGLSPGALDPHALAPGTLDPSLLDPGAPDLSLLERSDRLKAWIESKLAAFAVQARAAGCGHAAAVAVAIVDEGPGADLPGFPRHRFASTRAALILTRRSGGLRRHAGQWALPGGRIDAGETAEQAALRELAEEVDLWLDERAILGRLDDYVTRSGFVITPVVVWAGPAAGMKPNPAEVASIHRIPLAEFLRQDAPMLEHVAGNAHPVLRMPVGNSWIAAPTAAVLYQFREVCLCGRPTRVGHFDQPEFAWR